MALFTIWIDADSCPSLVRNHAIKIAYKLKLNIILVANKNIHCETDFPYEMKICSAQKDAADDYILENVTNNDLSVHIHHMSWIICLCVFTVFRSGCTGIRVAGPACHRGDM